MQNAEQVVKVIYSENYDIEKWGYLQPSTDGSAGYDMRACIDEPVVVLPGESVLIDLGIKIHIGDVRYAAILLPRSGLGFKGLVLGNLVGLIDSDYQGNVKAAMWNRKHSSGTKDEFTINPGDKVGQMVFIPVMHPRFQQVESFEETVRGSNGFGHTGV